MTVVIQIMGDALGGRMPPKPTFLKDFDFEHDHGQGRPVFTQKRSEAMKFDDPGKALDYWKTQSKKKPMRPDGKPNRPFTAWTVSILREDVDAL
jgi:hypothetical protein